MSEHCSFGTKSLDISGARSEREVEVEITGYYKDDFDTRRFSMINDKAYIPERSAKEGGGRCDSPDISPVYVRSRYSHRC